MEKRIIKKVGVLGSGVMGSRIACHFAGIGLQVLLLDIVPKEAVESKKSSERNKIVNDALTAAIKSNPSPVYHKDVIKKITTGNFDETLPPLLAKTPGIGLAFVDGNHRKTPTLQYFENLLPKMNTPGILIFDDIHWSREMEDAWQQIKDHPGCLLTIDLFFIGLVFFNPAFKVKQHFVIRF